jgi:hypothetical protein
MLNEDHFHNLTKAPAQSPGKRGQAGGAPPPWAGDGGGAARPGSSDGGAGEEL